MNKLITKITATVAGFAMAIGAGVGVAMNNRAATELNAGEEVYKQMAFLPANTNNSIQTYTASGTYTSSGFSVATQNFNNNQKKWSNIRCGRKNNASVATLTTSAAIDAAITKVSITIDSISEADVNSIKLYSKTAGAANWSEEATQFTQATGDQFVSLSNPAENLLYKVEFDCANTNTSTNGFVQVSAIKYYRDAGGLSFSVSPTSAKIAKNGTTTLTATADGGDGDVSWQTSDADIVSISSDTGASITIRGENRGIATVTASYSTASDIEVSIQVVDIQHEGTESSPYTVEEARDKIDLGEDLSDKCVTGIVSEIVTPLNTQYGNISYNISTDGSTTSEQFQSYRGKSFDGAEFDEDDDFEVGATVIIRGNLTKHNSTYELAADNYLVAYTPAPRYTVSFDSLGGSDVSPVGDLKKGDCVDTLPTPTKSKDTVNQKRFEFADWYVVDDPNNIVFEEENKFTTSTPVNGNITVYAKYNEINYYIVSFNTNGGNAIDNQEVDEGDTVSMPANPTKPTDSSYVYTFEAWYTNSGLTDAFVSSTPITSNLTLFAKYTEESIANPQAYVNLASSVTTIHANETPAGEEQTASETINDLVTANGWEVSSGTTIKDCYTSFDLDSNITVSTDGEPNCGTIWGTTTHDWRLYQNKSGNIVLTAKNGYALSSVKFTFNIGSNGQLKFGDDVITSNSVVDLSGNSATFDVGASSGTSGQVRITAIEVKYATPMEISNVALRFGATISKSDWDAINDNLEHPEWEITDYGVMFLKQDTLTNYGVSSVKEAFELHDLEKPVTIKHKGSGEAPYLDGDNYLFTIKVSIPAGYYGDVIYAAPFIKVNETYYFMEEKHESVNSLATYYRNNGGSSLSDDALDYLKTAH